MWWDASEAEVALERIWELHDRLSDAILAASRAHLLLPAPQPPPVPSAPPAKGAHRVSGGRNGCVFVKGGGEALAAAAEAVSEVRSLHAIRSALEDVEDHLEFLHTVQSRHQAEQDSAIARLEQSRLVLAMRLAEHQGKKHRIIDEVLAFVGEVSDKSQFISFEDVRATHSRSEDDLEHNRGNGSRIMSNMLSSSLSLAKNSFRLDKIGGALGNAAMFAVSMLAFFQLHQITFGSKTPAMEYRKRIEYSIQPGSSQPNGKGKLLEVYLARG
ncbi:Plastid division protein PDV1 [Zea mays]|uniref:Plastid division protein PDV1 n=1 Tax=Zea mays TaxID=4577 RepID=A0A3L6F951_MAIZE|nr:Plastid division protein PDV1 [Zea mays]